MNKYLILIYLFGFDTGLKHAVLSLSGSLAIPGRGQ